MNRRTVYGFLLFCFLFLASIVNVTAAGPGSFTMSFSGPASAQVGDTISVSVVISNITEPVGGAGATLIYDKSALQLVDKIGGTAMAISYGDDNPAKFLGINVGTGITATSTLVTYKFKTLKVGSTTISLSAIESTNKSYQIMNVTPGAYTVNVKAPLSGNTNLSSLSVSGTNISTGSFSANVGKDVSSITINAKAQDAGAVVTGTGTKSLNYGINTYVVTVTAPSGATRDYTITITREDPRSTNNSLSSLKVSDGDLKPGFNANTTTYSMTVPFKVSSIDVKATAQDGKAKVSVSGNTNLPSEATTDVIIRVTAENGDVKVYTIKVTREKDPDKPKANNNYLKSLSTDIGILSPVFNKKKTNYVIYLPYEVEKINLTAEIEDEKLAKLDTNAPSTLNVGKNRFEFKVTAEDGTTKSYIVNVIRGANVDSESNNIILKDIEISNGKLNTEFKSDVKVYKYTKEKDFKLTPIPEDKSTKVSVFEFEGVYNIILEGNEETNIYTLIPEEAVKESKAAENGKSNWGVVAAVISFIPIAGISSFSGYKFGKKTKHNKENNISIEEEYKIKEI